jgi:hypothetical protein
MIPTCPFLNRHQCHRRLCLDSVQCSYQDVNGFSEIFQRLSLAQNTERSRDLHYPFSFSERKGGCPVGRNATPFASRTVCPSTPSDRSAIADLRHAISRRTYRHPLSVGINILGRIAKQRGVILGESFYGYARVDSVEGVCPQGGRVVYLGALVCLHAGVGDLSHEKGQPRTH